MATIPAGTIKNADIASTSTININNPAINSPQWHSGNLPTYGNTTVITNTTLAAASLGGGQITAGTVSSMISNLTKTATRFRRAHFYKNFSGSVPGAGGCLYGDSGTQITSLTSIYVYNIPGTSITDIRSNYTIVANQRVDLSELNRALTDMAAKLATHRSSTGGTPVLQFGNCHCSCHNNCHGSRNRR